MKEPARWRWGLVGVALVNAGCATTADYQASLSTMTAAQVCAAGRQATDRGNKSLDAAASAERSRRGISWGECQRILAQQPTEAPNLSSVEVTNAVTGAVMVIAVAALIFAGARYGGGNLADSVSPDSDRDWDWDQFFSDQRVLVWACRGVQTGQFAEPFRCATKLKIDQRWPGTQFVR